MKKLLFLFLSCWLINEAVAQTSNTWQFECGTARVWHQQTQQDTGLVRQMQVMESKIQQFVTQRQANRTHGTNLRISDPVITIPIAIHIVGKAANDNIAQNRIPGQVPVIITNQINALNTYFNSLPQTPHPYSGSASVTRIQFCLAKDYYRVPGSTYKYQRTDPQLLIDAPSRNSSTPTESTVGQYLNIWVCDLNAGQSIGYSSTPHGNSATDEADGVVVDYTAFGFNASHSPVDLKQGKTLVHEIGHWLGLHHPWGASDTNTDCNSTDLINDTPPSGGPILTCQPTISDHCPVNLPKGNMYQNYMDYSPESCKDMFTLGQADWMYAQFEIWGNRRYILSSPGCSPTICPKPVGLDATPFVQGNDIKFTLRWSTAQFSGLQNYEIQIWPSTSGNPIPGPLVCTPLVSSTSVINTCNLNPNTTYYYRVRSNCGNSTSSSWSNVFEFSTPNSPSPTNSGTRWIGNAEMETDESVNGQTPYGTYYKSQKVQYILTREQLLNDGFLLVNNNSPFPTGKLRDYYINSLFFNIYGLQNGSPITPLRDVKIKILEINSTIDEFQITGNRMSNMDGDFMPMTNAVTVFSSSPGVDVSPANETMPHIFNQPYLYTGTHNLLIEISYLNVIRGINTQVFQIRPFADNGGPNARPLRQTIIYSQDSDVAGITRGKIIEWRPIIGLNVVEKGI